MEQSDSIVNDDVNISTKVKKSWIKRQSKKARKMFSFKKQKKKLNTKEGKNKNKTQRTKYNSQKRIKKTSSEPVVEHNRQVVPEVTLDNCETNNVSIENEKPIFLHVVENVEANRQMVPKVPGNDCERNKVPDIQDIIVENNRTIIPQIIVENVKGNKIYNINEFIAEDENNRPTAPPVIADYNIRNGKNIPENIGEHVEVKRQIHPDIIQSVEKVTPQNIHDVIDESQEVNGQIVPEIIIHITERGTTQHIHKHGDEITEETGEQTALEVILNATERNKLLKIEEIFQRSKTFASKVDSFEDITESDGFYNIDENLQRQIAKLDRIEIDDCPERIKVEKREAIKYIYNMIEQLEEKARENEKCLSKTVYVNEYF